MQIDWIDIPSGLRERYQYYTQAKIEKLKSQGLSSPQWSLERGIGDYLKITYSILTPTFKSHGRALWNI